MMFQVRISSVIAAIALLLSPVGAGAQGTDDPTPLFVRTMVVAAPEPTLTRQFFGRVAAVNTIDLAFEVGGRLGRLEAVEGRPIAQGDLIAELDQDPFERAVERAELSLLQSERDLERALSLLERNVGTRVGEQNARTARDLAEVALRDTQGARADRAGNRCAA